MRTNERHGVAHGATTVHCQLGTRTGQKFAKYKYVDGHRIGQPDLDCDPGWWDASAADAVCTNVNFDVTSE